MSPSITLATPHRSLPLPAGFAACARSVVASSPASPVGADSATVTVTVRVVSVDPPQPAIAPSPASRSAIV